MGLSVNSPSPGMGKWQFQGFAKCSFIDRQLSHEPTCQQRINTPQLCNSLPDVNK